MCSGGDSNVGLAGEGGDFDFRAKGGLDEVDRNVAKKIVAVALKDVVRFDVKDDVKVAMGSTADAGFAVAGAAQAGAAIDASGNFQLNLRILFAPTGAAANFARAFDDLTSAFAAAAGLGDAENAARHDDLAATAAGGADLAA